MEIPILVAFLFVHAVSSASECPPSKVFRECGTACPPTCKDPNPKICTEQCVRGCFCLDGLLENDEGQCVTMKDCNGTACPPNQHYECGTACPATCIDPNPKACIEICILGCFCNDGLVKNDSGECIALEDCPANVTTTSTSYQPDDQCPPNQHFEECGTACPATCKDPSPKICTDQCVRGCFCKAGLVRNDDGVCVDVKNCSDSNSTEPSSQNSECPPNQEFDECGTACPLTCKEPKPKICIEKCVRGCFCKAGLVKNDNGLCVDLKDCQAPTISNSCEKDEVWSSAPCLAPAACQKPRCPNNTVNSICAAVCLNGACVCKDGFYRDNHNNCVRLDKCNVEP